MQGTISAHMPFYGYTTTSIQSRPEARTTSSYQRTAMHTCGIAITGHVSLVASFLKQSKCYVAMQFLARSKEANTTRPPSFPPPSVTSHLHDVSNLVHLGTAAGTKLRGISLLLGSIQLSFSSRSRLNVVSRRLCRRGRWASIGVVDGEVLLLDIGRASIGPDLGPLGPCASTLHTLTGWIWCSCKHPDALQKLHRPS